MGFGNPGSDYSTEFMQNNPQILVISRSPPAQQLNIQSKFSLN
ncbi:hypothetical protein B6N60_02519 [Richelia sinica FACHB-800]|uniref:Uncharacterized protein n=1 Tax=Richelia sinica FACHB-800 TaxID=1357546 RepID=A0A975T9B8_9NOST|nr:hypothetical protein B6N60_02519 [Richelia sinica FACHB-800]